MGAADERALLEIRERLVAMGCCDGTITQFPGVAGFERPISIFVVDPDGGEMEVGCLRTDDVITDDMVIDFVPPVTADA